MDDPVNQPIEAAKLKRISIRGGMATAGAQGLKFTIRIAAQITIARLLLPADYGLIAMISPVLAFVGLIADMGLGQAVVQRPNITQKEVSGLFWFGLAANAGIAAVVAAASPLIALVYHEPKLVPITLVAAAMMPIASLATQPLALLARNLKFQTMALVDWLAPLAGFLAGLAAALAHWSYWSLVVAQAAEAFTLVVMVWIASRWLPSAPGFDRELKSVLKTGFHITGSHLADYATSTLDNIILGISGGSAVLGLYDKSYRTVTQPVGQLLAPFNRVTVPMLLRLGHDPDRYRTAFITVLELLTLMLIPGVITVAILAGPLFLWLLGSNWIGIGPIVSWLAFGCLSSPLYTGGLWLLLSQNRTAEQLRWSLVTAVLSVTGFIIGLPWGAAGVAAGGSIAFLALVTPMVVFGATRRGPVRLVDIVRAMTPFALAGCAAAAAVWFMHRSVQLHGFQLFAGFVIAYAGFGLVLVVLPSGRRMIARMWAMRRAFMPGAGA